MKRCNYSALIFGVCLQAGCVVIGSVKDNDSTSSVAASIDNGLKCMLINHADIILSDKNDNSVDEMTRDEILAMANHGHGIVEGEFTVISVREFIGSEFPDGQSFRKLTLKMNSDASAESIHNVFESYYTTGSTGFIENGFFYYSWNHINNVKLDRGNGQLSFYIDQLLPSTRAIDGRQSEIALRFSCDLQRMRVDQLTPWEGKAENSRAVFYPSNGGNGGNSVRD